MSFWMLTMTLGNVLVAFLAPLQVRSLSELYWLFAGLMSCYQGKTCLQSAQ